MPYLSKKRVWTQQPQGLPSIDFSNPLTKGLIGLFIPIGDQVYDLVSKTYCTNVGTVTATTNSQGVATKYSSSRSQYDSSYTYDLITEGTLLSLFRYTANAGSQCPISKHFYMTGYSLEIESSGNLRFVLGATGWQFTSLGTVNVGHNIAVASYSSISGITYGVLNSRAIASGTIPSNLATNSYKFCIGGSYAYGTYLNGDVNLTGVWSRAASPFELVSIRDNPWQIFKKQDKRILIPVSAGGGVSNIAASGTVQVGGTASPVVAVAMSGVGASLSSGTAADRVTVNIGAAGLATAAATAGISAQVLLAGAAAALASGNATLAATLNALASGAAQASGTATINSGVAGALAAVGTDVVSGSAPIRVTVSLGASGSDAVGGSAAIVGSPISSPLSGAGVDVVSGSGAAVINVSLSAAGFVQAMAAGQLSMQVRLSSTGASVVSGVAGITSLGVTVDAPNGYGPQIIRPKTRRPANLGGIRF